MNSSNFRESWLIPKNLILDYIQYKAQKEGAEQLLQTGGGGEDDATEKSDEEKIEKESQRGGGGASSNLATNFYTKDSSTSTHKKLPPSTRMKLVKNYLNQDRYQNQQLSDITTTALSSRKKNSVPKINLELLFTHFPEAERYKISYVISFINLKLPYQIQVDRGLNLIIEGKYMWDTSLPDVLKFLFGIDRRYLTEYRTVTDRNITYGIPKGTEEFLEVLKSQQSDLTRLGFNSFRLKLISNEEEQEDDSEGEALDSTVLDDGGGDDDDDNNEDGNNDDDDDLGGGAVGGENNPDFVTPENRIGKSAKSAKRSISRDPYFNRGKSAPPPATRRQLINQQEQEELLPPTTAPKNVQSEIEQVLQDNQLPYYTSTGQLENPTIEAPNLDGFLFNALSNLPNRSANTSQIHSLDRWTNENHGRKQQREMNKLKIASTSSFTPAEGKRNSRSKIPTVGAASKRKSKGDQEKNSVKFSSAEKKRALSRKGNSPNNQRRK